MSTPLYLRSTQVRLYIAYMADAWRSYPDTDTGNTLSRIKDSFDSTQDGDHKYLDMWSSIGAFFEKMGYKEMHDSEITDAFNAAFAIGFTAPNGTKVEASAIKATVKRWRNNGWFRYEQKRASRRKIFGRVAIIGLACVGLPIGGE